MLRSLHITTVGSCISDTFFITDQATVIKTPSDPLALERLAFEKGAKIAAQNVIHAYGGGALNTAFTFSSFGLRTQIITAIGSDTAGSDMLSYLKQHAIRTASVQRITDESTGTSFIVSTSDNRDHVIFVSPGAVTRLNLTEKKAASVRSPWIYIAGLSGSWEKNLRALFEYRKHTSVAWNPGGEQIAAGVKRIGRFLRKTDVLIVNRDEARTLLGGSFHHAQAAELSRGLGKIGPTVAVVTDGHRGSAAFDGKRIYRQKAVRVSVANKTGAGDAFGSAFVFGLIKKRGIQTALQLGAANSASVVTKFGAHVGILDKRRLNSILSS